mmetsp:Transcript_10716/g.21190  ORF Transcript_10716/g.21190 Transcript_10716/m.21190 type:complete len:577 (+) Transcript_10716:3-1733(+)
MTRTDETQEDGTERTALLSNYVGSSSLSPSSSSSTLRTLTPSTLSHTSSLRRTIADHDTAYGAIYNDTDTNHSDINNTARTVGSGNSTIEEEEVHNRLDEARTDVTDIEEGNDNSQQHDRQEGPGDATTTNQNIASNDGDADAGEGNDNSEQHERQQQRPSEIAEGDEPRDGAIGNLTRRLRCLFSTVTWPIVPLGTIVFLALLWVLYAASFLDLRKTCSHPLHSYALTSLILVAYIPNHSQIRSRIFHYSRERDGPIRPARVRMYDQFFHTVCLLYVYTGVTLIQTCREDFVDRNSIDTETAKNDLALLNDGPLNACQATCPNLYLAMNVYVATLELFTFALILPLLFLPCIYLWFLQRATADADAFARLQDQLQEETTLLSNGGITNGEIMDSMETVKMVSRRFTDSTPGNNNEFWILPHSARSIAFDGTKCEMKECCICMVDFDFEVQEEETGQDGALLENSDNINRNGNNRVENDENSDQSLDDSLEEGRCQDITKETSTIVRTKCGHIFQKECLKDWVGGCWSANINSSRSNNDTNNTNGDGSTPDWKIRKARQIHCPLCREDLRPTQLQW